MSKELQKLRDVIVRGYCPDRIILFGSRVWGNSKKGSDYDFFILKKGARKKFYQRTGDVLRIKREAGINIPMDVIVYNQVELNTMMKRGDQLYDDILNNGKVIYEK